MMRSMNALRLLAACAITFSLGCGSTSAPDASTSDARADSANDGSTAIDGTAQEGGASDSATPPADATVDSASNPDGAMCATAGQSCNNSDNPCCGPLVCMVRGGAGGTACADPMCRTIGQSCDSMHECCPSSACAGAPGAQSCLPTP
jgi:hypothetical protein